VCRSRLTPSSCPNRNRTLLSSTRRRRWLLTSASSRLTPLPRPAMGRNFRSIQAAFASALQEYARVAADRSRRVSRICRPWPDAWRKQPSAAKVAPTASPRYGRHFQNADWRGRLACAMRVCAPWRLRPRLETHSSQGRRAWLSSQSATSRRHHPCLGAWRNSRSTTLQVGQVRAG
jgi:hypothetical protein